ncbi:MAG: pyrroline-5-carboxylate reductase dimerization domain-containing protein [Mucinivorans sp.]
MNIIIIGAGNMGGAIARGLAALKDDILIVDKNEQVLSSFKALGYQTCSELGEYELIPRRGALTILAVKPWLVESVAAQYSSKLSGPLLSVAAGVSVAELKRFFGDIEIIRCIPNTAVEFGAGVSFLTMAKPNCEVEKLFERLGTVSHVEQNQLDAAMIMGSCGLAFALRYARAAQVAGVELGMKPEQGQRVLAGVLRGAAALLERGQNPETEIDKITTPGGVTIKGLNEMERAGFSNSVISGHKICKN